MSEVCLNLGASKTYIPGFVNIDIAPWADYSLDIGKDPLPFEDNSVDVVFSFHTLEHVDDYLFALSEVFRVLKHGGRFLLGVPYVSSTKYNLVNPYHKHHFNEFSFYFFDEARLKGSASEPNRILFKQVFHRFHYMGIFKVLPQPFRYIGRTHLFNVVSRIDFGLIAIKDQQVPVSDSGLKKEFDRCLKARTFYPDRK